MLIGADGARLWMPHTTIDILDRTAARWPGAVALACEDERLTYAEYRERVRAVAGALAARGVQGGRVAIVLRNGIDIALALFGVQAAGAATASLNPDYTPGELAPILSQVEPTVAITHDDLRETLAPLLPATCAVLTVAELEAESPGTAALPAIDPASAAVLQFTGGTTGTPKGALLSHRAVATNVAQREAVLPTRAGDERIICMMPLYHSFAAAMCLHMSAYCGGALHILPRYRPDWLLDTIARERITRLPAGPTVFNSLLGFDGLNREQVTSLVCAYSGSAPLPHDTLARWEAATGVPIYEGYGQSEAGPVLTYHGPGMALKQGSVGPPLPLTELRIDGEGPLGEVLARGPQIMDGYLGRAEETADTLKDGWLHTGDIGRLDADGYLFIEDRKKDMAIVGGYNVYPREIDEVLNAHAKVREAGAVGVPDAYRGEVIWAFVAGEAPDEADVQAHCAERLAKYKRPVRLVVLDALPRTPVGKIDKQALKALAQAMREEAEDAA
ncbi:AMP-binding protein [Erythrobacter sp. NFXS35]|uniref:AMP-binding protein n=1 Tax=Erythrobacter sp. NFXS35 TaxID=2818436 RepID=UPI0032E05004